MGSPLYHTVAATRDVRIVATDRSDGDMHPDRVDLETLRARQTRATGRPWAMLDEVHGLNVVDVDDVTSPSFAGSSATIGVGDVGVTSRDGTHLAVWTADCAPLFLIASDGTVVGAHCGWRGLADGIVDVAVRSVTRRGGRISSAVLGPSIGPCCYAFGRDDLARVAAGVRAEPADVVGSTASGEHALDVPAAVRAALARHGIAPDVTGPCTGCDDRWYSHRVRADPERHATIAVLGMAR